MDVTPRYVPDSAAAATPMAVRSIRVWDRPGGERVVAKLRLLVNGCAPQEAESRAGRADLNDMPRLAFEPGKEASLEVHVDGQTHVVPLRADTAGESTLDLHVSRLGVSDDGRDALLAETAAANIAPANAAGPLLDRAADEPLSEADAEELLTTLAGERRSAVAAAGAAELEAKAIRIGDRELKLLEKTFGEAPAVGHSLWISMHGGGNTRAAANDRQWRNQIRLYELEEGIYVAPRAPTNTWNLWHEAHIDDLFDRLIDVYVATRGVDPNRVYLLGYSAGGDGVYQLAPRMADRFAAASMMAGHPNDANPLGLRNLPFAIFMGGKDSAYKRNEVAAAWGEKLDALEAADPEGYVHRVTIYPDHGHWMQGDDKEALPWMAEQTRDPWPKRVVWHQSRRTHTRFYWLAVPADQAKPGTTITATVTGQTIGVEVDGVSELTLRLRDTLVDLDRPIRVVRGDEVLFEGVVPRTLDAIRGSLAERLDPPSAATAVLALQL